MRTTFTSLAGLSFKPGKTVVKGLEKLFNVQLENIWPKSLIALNSNSTIRTWSPLICQREEMGSRPITKATRRPVLVGTVPFLTSASRLFVPIKNHIPFSQECIISKLAPSELKQTDTMPYSLQVYITKITVGTLKIFTQRVKFSAIW